MALQDARSILNQFLEPFPKIDETPVNLVEVLAAIHRPEQFHPYEMLLVVGDDREFDPETMINHIIWNIWEQRVRLAASTWKQLTKFFDVFVSDPNTRERVAGFDRRSNHRGQLGLEILYTASKASADEMHFYWAEPNQSRDGIYNEYIWQVLQEMNKPSFEFRFETKSGKFLKTTKLRQFLMQDFVVQQLATFINDMLHYPEGDFRHVTADDVKKQIDQLRIYTCSQMSNAIGVTVRDGFVIARDSLSGIFGDLKYLCDVLMLGLHEVVHYLFRFYWGNYEFCTPSSGVPLNEPMRRRNDENGILLESGSAFTKGIFSMEVDWDRTTKAAAVHFLQLAKDMVGRITPEAAAAMGLKELLSPPLPFAAVVCRRP